jgi:5-methylthioadenosine/S-adenosylhomocysteine deaminase
MAERGSRGFATLIRGGLLVVPGESGGLEAIAGDLLMKGDRIVELGRIDDVPRGTRIIYAGGCAVLPGFVQSHVHLCQTLFRGLADDLSLLDWLERRIWPLEGAHTPQSLRASARLAVAELLLGGTTAIQTMETVHHTAAVFEVLAEAGIYAVSGKCLMDDPDTCPPSLWQPTDVALREAVDLAEEWDGSGNGRLRVCLSPRFAVSCTDACLTEVASLATDGGWRVHTHAAESREELALVQRRSGQRAVTHLESVGIAGPHVGLAHCVWLDDEEIESLARHRTHVLHCPGSNCKLGSGLAPIPRLLRHGVPVSLGSDGAACNNSLDMFREMRLATLIQKTVHGPEALPAAEVIDLATRGGAAALGRERDLGTLRAGAVANVVLVNLEATHATPSPDPLATLVYSSSAADIRAVWLAGQQVVAEGRLTLWDEEEIRREAQKEARGLVGRAGL